MIDTSQLIQPGDTETIEPLRRPPEAGSGTEVAPQSSVPMPWQWGTAGQTLAGQAGGLPQATPYPWQLGTGLAQQAGTTGLPTQAPMPWLQGMAGTQQAMQTGLPTQMPGIWGQLGGLATQMATTGAPTSQDPWYQQAKQVAGRDIASSIGQAAEQAGLKGMRWSSPLARQAQEIAARRMGEVGLEWTGRELGALEAARGRQLQAMPLMQQVGAGQAGLSEAARQRQFGALPLQLQFGGAMAGLGEAARGRQMQALSPLYQFGAGQAGLGESAQQRALQAAGQLAPLGQMAGQFPMDVAQRAMQMGGTMQQQQMMQIAPLMQEFLRQTPEASPWLQMAMGATRMPFQQAPMQYQQSPFSQILGAGAAIAPYAFMASSAQFKKDVSEVTNEDEEKIFEQMKDTPIFKYRYKFEDNEITPHLGLITETSPDEVTLFDNKAIGLYEYISTLHAMIKVLSRKIEKLEI